VTEPSPKPENDGKAAAAKGSGRLFAFLGRALKDRQRRLKSDRSADKQL